MNSSRSPEIMTERPSLPGIHDLFGEHLAHPIKRASPFTFNALSSSLPMRTSQTSYDNNYESTQPSIAMRRLIDSERVSPQPYVGTKNPHGAVFDHRHLQTKKVHSTTMLTSRYHPSLPSNYADQGKSLININRGKTDLSIDTYSQQSTATSGDEHGDPLRERKRLPAKYECEYCGKFFNRPSSLKIHHNTHTGQKPFSCIFPGCGRSFSVMSNMRRHARTHGDSAMHSTREQSDSELQLTPAPSASSPSSRSSSRSATPLSSQHTGVASRALPLRERSGSISSDSSGSL